MFTSARAIKAAVAVMMSAAALLVTTPSAHAISGGQVVPTATYKAKYRFLVQLKLMREDTSTGKDVPYNCVGALIAPKKVLTAASCMLGAKVGFKVIGGRKNLNGKDGTVSSEGKIILPQDYDWPKNDVAVVHLTKAMPYTPVKVVSSSYQYKPNTPARILGWGASNATEERKRQYSNELRMATTSILPDSTCKSSLPEDFDPDTMVCGGRKKKGDATPCGGERGLPLLVTQGKEEYVAGVASWGSGSCGKAGSLDVYTQISRYSVTTW